MKSITIAALLVLFAQMALCQEWRSLNDVVFQENTAIRTFDPIGDSLFLGGSINLVNGVASIGSIYWDSLQVSVYSPGLDKSFNGGNAYSHEIYNDTLFIGGDFIDVNDIWYTRGIAKWSEGSIWETVGGSCVPTDHVSSLIVFDEYLYASHNFTEIGNLEDIYGFARWNGFEWEEVEAVWGFDPGPSVMCIFQDQLWGGGFLAFTSTMEPVNNVAYFDGEQWHDPNGGMGGRVVDLLPDEDEGVIYVVGNGTTAQNGEVSCPNNVCYYDGSNWHSVGEFNDIDGNVACIAKYRDQLYVGGWFEVDGISYKLAYFDGYHWQPVPDAGELDGWVYDLEVYKDELYVGGSFSDIADLGVKGVARYYLDPDSVTWGEPDSTINVVEQFYETTEVNLFPNPASQTVSIEANHSVSEITITNARGQSVMHQLCSGQSAVLNIAELHTGVYTVVVSFRDQYAVVRKRLVVK
jgi:hypothetical protein